MMPWLLPGADFPPLETALREPNGLLAVGGDLTPATLLAAYRRGIFPWFNPGDPPMWWSPDPRMVLWLSEFKLSRSLAKVVRNKPWQLSCDLAFPAVIRACAAPRDYASGTWISEAMIDAYVALHRQGHAHSFETWWNGRLVGGLYGVAIGRMFYGESMFSCRTDASKVAVVAMVRHLTAHGFKLVDCQMHTGHLASLGARAIPRAEFVATLSALTEQAGQVGRWTLTDSPVGPGDPLGRQEAE